MCALYKCTGQLVKPASKFLPPRIVNLMSEKTMFDECVSNLPRNGLQVPPNVWKYFIIFGCATCGYTPCLPSTHFYITPILHAPVTNVNAWLLQSHFGVSRLVLSFSKLFVVTICCPLWSLCLQFPRLHERLVQYSGWIWTCLRSHMGASINFAFQTCFVRRPYIHLVEALPSLREFSLSTVVFFSESWTEISKSCNFL